MDAVVVQRGKPMAGGTGEVGWVTSHDQTKIQAIQDLY